MSTCKCFWISEKKGEADDYTAFRGSFTLEKESYVEFNFLGAHWFQIELDGKFLTEGPARFPATNPEFEILKRKLPAGKHVIATIVHNHGLKTRTLDGEKISPFFSCDILSNALPIATTWKCRKLEGTFFMD